MTFHIRQAAAQSVFEEQEYHAAFASEHALAGPGGQAEVGYEAGHH